SAASGSRRRCSPGSASRTGSPGKRSSVRCCQCSPSAPRRRRSSRRTTRPTACRRGCGPTKAAGSSGWRSSCGPAWCGPTPTTGSTRRARLAATGSLASGGRAAGTGWPHISMPDRAAKPGASKPAAAASARRAVAAASAGESVAAKPGGGHAGRLGVRKTYKLFIGGAFPRSESGRSYPVTEPGGGLLAHAALASRKDARDAVVAARAAVGRWSGATAYNRGQVLYRVAELLEGRGSQFAAEIVQSEGLDLAAAADQVARAIDRWVWYAGWPDKVAQGAGPATPVAGPYFNFSIPEPTGVVAVVAPADSSLLGLVS